MLWEASLRNSSAAYNQTQTFNYLLCGIFSGLFRGFKAVQPPLPRPHSRWHTNRPSMHTDIRLNIWTHTTCPLQSTKKLLLFHTVSIIRSCFQGIVSDLMIKVQSMSTTILNLIKQHKLVIVNRAGVKTHSQSFNQLYSKITGQPCAIWSKKTQKYAAWMNSCFITLNISYNTNDIFCQRYKWHVSEPIVIRNKNEGITEQTMHALEGKKTVSMSQTDLRNSINCYLSRTGTFITAIFSTTACTYLSCVNNCTIKSALLYTTL